MRWVETSSFSYFSPLVQDNAHIVGTWQRDELWLGGGKLANSIYLRRGQGLHHGVRSIQLCSFGKLLASSAHLSDLSIWLCFLAHHCSCRWGFWGLLLVGKATQLEDNTDFTQCISTVQQWSLEYVLKGTRDFQSQAWVLPLGHYSCKSCDTVCFCSCITQTQIPRLTARWHFMNPRTSSNSHHF